VNKLLLLSIIGAAGVGATSTTAALALATDPPKISALQSGTPTTLSAADLAVAQSLSDYGPQPAQARRIPAAGGETWTVFPASNGGACIQVPDRTIVCGPGGGISNGRYGVITVDAPPAAELARQASARRAVVATSPGATSASVTQAVRTAAVRRGLVPDGVAKVVALAPDGSSIASAIVSNNGYVLSLGREGDASRIRLVGADGSTVAESDLS
jgi:hypothetical protein